MNHENAKHRQNKQVSDGADWAMKANGDQRRALLAHVRSDSTGPVPITDESFRDNEFFVAGAMALIEKLDSGTMLVLKRDGNPADDDSDKEANEAAGEYLATEDVIRLDENGRRLVVEMALSASLGQNYQGVVFVDGDSQPCEGTIIEALNRYIPQTDATKVRVVDWIENEFIRFDFGGEIVIVKHPDNYLKPVFWEPHRQAIKEFLQAEKRSERINSAAEHSGNDGPSFDNHAQVLASDQEVLTLGREIWELLNSAVEQKSKFDRLLTTSLNVEAEIPF